MKLNYNSRKLWKEVFLAYLRALHAASESSCRKW